MYAIRPAHLQRLLEVCRVTVRNGPSSGTFDYRDDKSFEMVGAGFDSSDDIHFRATRCISLIRMSRRAFPLEMIVGAVVHPSCDERYFTGKERDTQSGNDYFGADTMHLRWADS